MNKSIDALKLALEALEKIGLRGWVERKEDAITAIREALADQCVCGEPDTPGTHRTDGPCLAEQPDSECKEDDGCPTEKAVLQRFWRKAQQQESVAFDVRCDDCGGSGLDRTDNNYRCAVCDGSGFVEKMLYTSPPYEATPLASQRSVKPWVGLTDEEVEATFWPWKQRTEYSIPLFEYRVIAQAIEAKLKEKNGF